MASNQPGRGVGGVTGCGSGGFDTNNLLKPSSNQMSMIPNSTNLTTSPSFPSPSSVSSPSAYLTPSSSYPPPTGPYPPYHYFPPPPPPQHQLFHHHHQQQNSPQILYSQQIPQPPPPSHNPNPNSTSSSGNNLLMAFFANQNQNKSPAFPPPSDSTVVIPPAPPVRLRSSKVPEGRHLVGNHSVYDIDIRLEGEVQPQLEVTPITKYISDPGLVLGRQIAVNRTYICYGLKLGNIRILNIITALRSLLRGHTQRVIDMAFFAEDVHLLASASVDGRFFIWNITEGPDEEDKPQILGKIIVAIQILADQESVHPRVCWHPHKQEILMVAIGNRILKIDSSRVGKGERFSAEESLKCPIDDLINGVQHVGKHDGEVTELSMCQWLTTRLASASLDGTVKIWDDHKATPLAVLRPYDGQPVNSVTFLIGPQPQHIVLITGGPLNRELKIWASAEEEGWLLPSDVESWKCTQTLELKSSVEPWLEDAFFNLAVALNRAGLFLLANAKKNAIYAVHIDYGPNPASTCMDYLAEFTVTMPILSLTGTIGDGSPDGEHIVQVYCVQTQAIQQYALDLSQCLPPPLENAELEKTDSNAACAFEDSNSDGPASLELSHGTKSADMPVGTTLVPSILSSSIESAPIASRPESFPSLEVTSLSENASGAEKKPNSLTSGNADNIRSTSPPLPLSPRLFHKSSGFRSQLNDFEPCPQPNEHGGEQSITDYSVDYWTNTAKEKFADVPFSSDNLWESDRNNSPNDISLVPDPPVVFKHPTHLVTPSEILSTAASSSENSQFSQHINVGEAKVQDVVVSNDAECVEVEVKVVGETDGQNNEFYSPRESHITVKEKKEKSFYSQASDLGIQMARECCVGTYNVDGIQQFSDVNVTETPVPSNNGDAEEQDTPKDAPAKVSASEAPMVILQFPSPATKGRKQRGKNSQISGTSSPSPSSYNSTDSSNEQACSSGATSTDATISQLLAMQDMLDQMMNLQKDMQKQMNSVVSALVNKEGKRLEASLGRSIEKVVKANTDALWARFQEENAKHEKLERDRMRQITNLITNTINKDLPAMFEKTLKKEIVSIGPAVARAISPTLEKSISSAIVESLQKGVGEKAVSQLEKSVSLKLETTVARQIQAQFQTSGKQALQDALRSNLESSIIPSFEMLCKTMFEQIDSAFQKGLLKHTTAIQQQFETAHSPMATALRDAINSATSVAQSLIGELAVGQRKLLTIAAAGANTKTGNLIQSSNGPLVSLLEMVEAPLDPTKELSRLIAKRKYEEAFTGALHRSDVTTVSWLCSQVDLQGILSMVPLPLSQGVLLALLQQLACDISKELPRKLAWMTDVALAVNPADPMIAMHVRPILEQVYQILGHHRNQPTTSASEANSIRLLIHVINSVLMSCK